MVRIPVAQSAADLHEKLEAFRQTSTYSAERIRLSEVDSFMLAPHSNATQRWQSQSNGDISRGDGLFFQVSGARVSPKGPKGSNYDQPMFVEEERGFAALVFDKETGDVLLEMKAEPGNDEAQKHIAFAPTLQMSQGRLKLGEKNLTDTGPSLLGALVGLGLDTDKSTYVQQDGGRFWRKRNGYETIGVANKEAMEAHATPSMIWTNAVHLGAEINLADCNSHLAQCIGIHALKSQAR